MRLAVQAILASPRFLFRIEQVPGTVRAGQTYRIGDLDLASRLSFFLWGAVPDDELSRAATQARCAIPWRSRSRCGGCWPTSDPRRCRRDSPAQWLRLQDVEQVRPDHHFYSYWDTTLSRRDDPRDASCSSTASSATIAASLELLTADYTFVNERLAKHYGIPNVHRAATSVA